LIVLVAVADQILKREAVVGGHEVDARVRAPATLLVEIVAAGQSRRELGHHAVIASPEAAHRIPILAVPLGPEDREVADLIPALPEVPWLGNQLHLRDDRVLMNNVEE